MVGEVGRPRHAAEDRPDCLGLRRSLRGFASKLGLDPDDSLPVRPRVKTELRIQRLDLALDGGVELDIEG